MIIFPAIDIKGGKCVRLLKGDFSNITQYKKSPIDQASEFYKEPFVDGIDFLFLGSISNAVLNDLANPLKQDSIMW